jgi:hypothetical protein
LLVFCWTYSYVFYSFWCRVHFRTRDLSLCCRQTVSLSTCLDDVRFQWPFLYRFKHTLWLMKSLKPPSLPVAVRHTHLLRYNSPWFSLCNWKKKKKVPSTLYYFVWCNFLFCYCLIFSSWLG